MPTNSDKTDRHVAAGRRRDGETAPRRARTLQRSRNELRHMQEQVRWSWFPTVVRRHPGTVADFDVAAETINMDDYVVSVVD